MGNEAGDGDVIDDEDAPESTEHRVAEERSASSSRGPRRNRFAVALLVLVLIAVAVLGAVLWSSRADLQTEIDRRDDIAAVSGRFAEALLSYDHEDLETSRDAVTELATPDFAEEYAEAFETGLASEILTLEARSTATVREVFVSVSEGDRARSVVVADSEIISAAGARATVGTYLDLTLIRLDGTWQVDDVTSVANAGERLDPVPGDEPTGDEPTDDEPAEGDADG